MSHEYSVWRQISVQMRFSPFSGRFAVTITEQSFDSGAMVERCTELLPRGIDPDEALQICYRIVREQFTESDDLVLASATDSGGTLEETPM
jgi:hypothetical protein